MAQCLSLRLGLIFFKGRNVRQPLAIAYVISGALLWPACTLAQVSVANFEAVPLLTAADLVPAQYILGPHHALVDPVRIDGYQARFDIQSAYGHFSVAGRELLSLRVAELPAIEALGRINKGDAFGEALAKAAKAPLDFVGKLLTAPAATLDSVASGVGQLVGKAGNVVKSGVDSVADGVSDLVSAKDQGAATSEEPPPPSFISDPFGYNKARRQWAKSLNVDPYTSNPVLNRLLDDAASATFAGSFAVDTTLGLVAAPVKFAVGFDAESREAVLDLSPGDIESRLETRLAVIGISGRPVRDFFRNRWFTPTLQTGLVVALEKLTNVAGRAAIIEVAARVQGEARVRSLIESINLLGEHHRRGSPLAELRLSAPLVVAVRQDGGLAAALSVDYFFWNAAAAELVARPELQGARRTLLVSGRVSSRTREEMQRAGWEVIEAGVPRPQPVTPASG